VPSLTSDPGAPPARRQDCRLDDAAEHGRLIVAATERVLLPRKTWPVSSPESEPIVVPSDCKEEMSRAPPWVSVIWALPPLALFSKKMPLPATSAALSDMIEAFSASLVSAKVTMLPLLVICAWPALLLSWNCRSWSTAPKRLICAWPACCCLEGYLAVDASDVEREAAPLPTRGAAREGEAVAVGIERIVSGARVTVMPSRVWER